MRHRLASCTSLIWCLSAAAVTRSPPSGMRGTSRNSRHLRAQCFQQHGAPPRIQRAHAAHVLRHVSGGIEARQHQLRQHGHQRGAQCQVVHQAFGHHQVVGAQARRRAAC